MLNPVTRATERDITLALKARHQRRGDYFASQVKMGAAGSKILDAIAIPPTWSPRTVIGYEIKVTRSDFLSDQKYPHYMSTSNLFYFVVPKGLIKKEEVPQRVGILEYNNGKLRQIKRAVYENVEINSDMLLHCIFYKIHEYRRPMTRQEHLDNVKARVEAKDYGSLLGRKISDLTRKKSNEESDGERNWRLFVESFEQKCGFKPYSNWDLMKYFSKDNRKYNEAIDLLERAARLFKEEAKL